MMNIEASSHHFAEKGWLVMDFVSSKTSSIFGIRNSMLDWLRANWISGLASLEEYHLHVEDDKRHIEIQTALSEHYQKSGFGPLLIRENLDFFRGFLGVDLHVQKFPYLRIARPGKPQDNIGIHRDTHYGSSPFELSVSVPFTDTGVEGSLGVVSGTHLLSEAALPTTQLKSEGIERGSTKHKLGFLYAPKQMSDEVRASVVPVPVKVGQALIFSLSLVHGQEINRSSVTRIQSDVRVVNSLAPIKWERNVHSDYYEPLCCSAVTEQAREYIRVNS